MDAPPLASPPEARRSSSRSGGDSISTGGDGNDSSSASAANHTGAATAADSASLEAFGFAVEELSRMCGEDGGVPESSAGGVPGGGWTLLGLPLRFGQRGSVNVLYIMLDSCRVIRKRKSQQHGRNNFWAIHVSASIF